jgi:hypothetical protein
VRPFQGRFIATNMYLGRYTGAESHRGAVASLQRRCTAPWALAPAGQPAHPAAAHSRYTHVRGHQRAAPARSVRPNRMDPRGTDPRSCGSKVVPTRGCACQKLLNSSPMMSRPDAFARTTRQTLLGSGGAPQLRPATHPLVFDAAPACRPTARTAHSCGRLSPTHTLAAGPLGRLDTSCLYTHTHANPFLPKRLSPPHRARYPRFQTPRRSGAVVFDPVTDKKLPPQPLHWALVLPARQVAAPARALVRGQNSCLA